MNTYILSFTKPIPTAPSHILTPNQTRHLQPIRLTPIRSSSGSGSGSSSDTTNDSGGDAATPSPPPITPSETVQIKFRRGSRKRSRKYQEDDGFQKKPEVKAVKDWESMTLTEKALELYIGEKGLLYWINKFAYASIFIIIGAWIVFRFVGPALNLYQLDAPPLSPTDVLKGSS